MEDETLIMCVQNRSSIYDKRDPLHHNMDHIQKQWEAIAQEMGCEVNAVKSRWGHMRDYFLKKRREYQTVKSGQAATGKKKWHLYDTLSFLTPIYEQRDTSSNLSQENSGETTQATESLADLESQASSPMTVRSDTPPPQAPVVPYKRPQKRKRTASPGNDVDTEILKSLQLQQPECLDDDDMWARSIVPSVRSLNHLEKLEFRLEVLRLL
ncbi:hypothetical protein RRG08_043262 [Elysia crispata]|uniref:MADF domain-containing protein n=1 Tax=Elysia crispata TaxID=231223 RepID=A0AAE1CNX0_9GAST|nr:hypothetical protein RRG08_043262 [Elysia crispata]